MYARESEREMKTCGRECWGITDVGIDRDVSHMLPWTIIELLMGSLSCGDWQLLQFPHQTFR